MKPTIARIVLYTLSAADAEQIMRRRTSGSAIAERIKNNSITAGDLDQDEALPPTWPLGAQAHIGNDVKEGDVFPLLITRLWSATCVNGQVFLDGNDQLWVTSALEGTTPGTWAWPVIPSKIADSMPEAK